jgi:hypothetical protein
MVGSEHISDAFSGRITVLQKCGKPKGKRKVLRYQFDSFIFNPYNPWFKRKNKGFIKT